MQLLVTVKLFILLLSISIAYGIPPYLDIDDSWAQDILNQLTLREKIGQLFVVAAVSNFHQPTMQLSAALHSSPYVMDQDHVEKMIQEYHVGGVIFLFKSDPKTQMELMQTYQRKSKTPLLMVQDAEWGLSMRLDSDPHKVVRYPHNMALGAIMDEELMYKLGYEIGRQCAAIGVHINCAPVCDVNNNPSNPVIHDRSFGDDPERVARLAELYARGLQDAGIIACAKHFPGHGDTHIDSHLDLPVIPHDKQRLNDIELLPFKKLIQANIGAVMNAHLAVPALESEKNRPSSLSHNIVTKELKQRLGFEGLIISDGLGMEAITKYYQPGQLELEAFLAGNDILLCPLDVPRAVELIEQAIIKGDVCIEDLNQRVLKILKAKKWAYDHQTHINKDVAVFLVRPEAHSLEEELYRKALTLAKNIGLSFNHETFKQSCIIQVGKMPENCFANTCKTYHQNVYICSAHMTHEELNHWMKAAATSDRVIIALSELHKNAQRRYGIADNTCQLIRKLKTVGKRVTVVVFGTPYSLKYLQDADALLVAYEDAQPAQKAVVDMLRGELQPTGKLPIVL